MRAGPSVDELTRAGVGGRVNVMRGKIVLAVGVPAVDIRYSYTVDRDVPAQVKFSAPLSWLPEGPLEPLNNFGQRVQVFSVVETAGVTYEIELGWFLITGWEENGSTIDVVAVDLMQVLKDNPLDWPSSPPTGASLRSELQRLCGFYKRASLPVTLECADFPISDKSEWGTNRIDAITDLCAAHGLDFAVKADGVLHVWERRNGRIPLAHYEAKDLLIDAPRASTARRANRWTVAGTNGSGEEEVKYLSTVEAVDPPFDPAGYGLVNDRSDLSSAETKQAVQLAAQTKMVEALAVGETRSLEIVMDPRLEGGDVISLMTEEGEPLVGRVVALDMTLDDPKKTMRVDVEVLAW